tara:strand:- start:4 stop:375 length:372 start_codon:yes stop_codon:yes gene_type:complete
MILTVTQTKGYSIVKVEANKLGGVLSPELKDKFVELNQLGVKSMIFNLGNVQYCDSSGLSAILVGNRLCKDAGGAFVICEINDIINKLIQISQLDSILTIISTQQEAMDFLIMDNIEKGLDNE